MIESIRYRGVLIDESRVSGEGKRDGRTPNYAQGIRVSPDRWLLLYDTVDARGWDIWRAIFYQVRADAPDGPVLTEAILTPPACVLESADGSRLWRHCGQPAVFGRPRGEAPGGSEPPHANVFAITWTTLPVLERDGALHRVPTQKVLEEQEWPAAEMERAAAHLGFYREILQVRLNDRGDDIEILTPRRRLHQRGVPGVSYGGWAQPVADNEERSEWLEAVSRGNRVGVIRYRFNPSARLYEWTDTGPFAEIREGLHAQEQTLARLGEGDYVVAVRAFNLGGWTYWFRTRDPFAGLGTATAAPDTYGQRYAFRCADGVLRIFLNNRGLSPYGDRRNPLYCWDINPDSFSYANLRAVMDARKEGLRLAVPFVDHVHLFAPQGNRQILSHRTITARQVARSADFPDVTPAEWEDGGIHYSEIVYGGSD